MGERQAPSGLAVAMVDIVYTSPGFETTFAERLRGVVAELPKGTAELQFEKRACGSPSPLPHFSIAPSNPRSSPIEGFFVQGEGINFSIGRATSREIYIANKTGNNANAEEDEFFRICQAVFTTRFSEKVVYDSRGNVIWSRIVLGVDSRKVVLGGHRIFWWLHSGKNRKQFEYEPYY